MQSEATAADGDGVRPALLSGIWYLDLTMGNVTEQEEATIFIKIQLVSLVFFLVKDRKSVV